jgi:glycosyltransferase involved in cell wall biosynthesis
MGYNVFIAGNFSNTNDNLFYLKKLIEDDTILKINTNKFPEYGLNIKNIEFINLQKEHNIDITVIIEADNHIALIISQLFRPNCRFQGRVVGVFLRPWHLYHKLNFINSLRSINNLRTSWKSDSRFFYKFLNRTFNLLDSSLSIDEFFVSKNKKIVFLPDVWQQYADTFVSEKKSEQRIWMDRLDEFKRINDNGIFILYFGTAQKRRGYDTLLKLAIDNDACFIHCGLRSYKEKFNYDVDEFRGILDKRGKLLETNEFISDPNCIDYYFKSVNYVVLPYEESFLGSSGVMLQALSYGIPVLVRDKGLLGYLVKKYNLGLTFSQDLLGNQFLRFINMPKKSFSNSIEQYMKFQSLDRFESVLINSFKG